MPAPKWFHYVRFMNPTGVGGHLKRHEELGSGSTVTTPEKIERAHQTGLLHHERRL